MLIVMLLCHRLLAQTVPDSLTFQLNHAGNDSTKSAILLKMGESIEATMPATSMRYYQQALLLVEKSSCNTCTYSVHINIGNCYIEMNKMDSAIAGFEKATTIARQLKDSFKVARALGNLGNVYLHKNDRVKAMTYYLGSATLMEKLDDHKILPIAYSNINALLEEQGEHAQALKFSNKAVTLAQKYNDTLSWIDGLVNMSVSYNGLNQFDDAYQILEQALSLAKNNGDIYQLVTIFNNIGDYFMQKKDFNNALSRFSEMHKYAEQMDNKYFVSSSTLALARVYHELRKEEAALRFIIQAEALADEVGERAELKTIYSVRGQIEQALGNYKLASQYYSKDLDLSDSLFQIETSEKVAEAEAKYQNEKKQQEILQLEKDKAIQLLSLQQKSTLNYLLIGSLSLALIAAFFVYRNLRNRQLLNKQQDELQKKQISELEKDRQLIAVDSMLKGQEEERSRLAKDLHDGLGGLLSGVKFSLSNMKDNLIITRENRAVFERSLDMLDTSIKELRRVAHNMMPEMLTKFGLDEALKEYCNSITATQLLHVKYQSHRMQDRIDTATEIIIYRIIQELLNNALKHAGATEVFVQLVKEEGRLSVVVEDNGKGFDLPSAELVKGAGLVNIRSRIDYLKGELDIHSLAGKGTLINMEFKV